MYRQREKQQVKKHNSKITKLTKEWLSNNWLFAVMFCACLVMLLLALGMQK